MIMFDLVVFLVIALLTTAATISNLSSQASAEHLTDIILKSGLVGTIVGLLVTIGNMGHPRDVSAAYNIAQLPIIYGAILAFGYTLITSNREDDQSKAPTGLAATLSICIWLSTVIGAVLYGGDYRHFINVGALVIAGVGAAFIAIYAQRSKKPQVLSTIAFALPLLGLLTLGVVTLAFAILGDESTVGPAASIGYLTLLYSLSISVCLQLVVPNRVYPARRMAQWMFASTSVICCLVLFETTLKKIASG